MMTEPFSLCKNSLNHALSNNALATDGVKHTIGGRLVDEEGLPWRYRDIAIYAKNIFGLDSFLGRSASDEKGNFCIEYRDERWINHFYDHRLVIKIFEPQLPFSFIDTILRPKEYIIYSAPIEDSVVGVDSFLGETKIPIHEYQKSLPLRQKEPHHKGEISNPKYTIDLVLAGFNEAIKSALTHLFNQEMTAEKVQAIYGSKDPTLTANEESTLELILNGLYPAYPLKTNVPGQFFVEVNWDRYTFADGVDLPNVRLFLQQVERDEADLVIDRVELTYRGEETKTYRPGDDLFNNGLYRANCSFLVKGELSSHLGRGHIWTEQVAAAFDKMTKNPLKMLLQPHIRDVSGINELGSTAIFGKQGVLATALAPDSIVVALKDILAGMDYLDFAIREPLSSKHRYAKASKIIWEAIETGVIAFFQQNEQLIRRYWSEVYDVSYRLVHKSEDFQLWDGHEYEEWYDSNEIGKSDSEIPRDRVEGRMKAMRHITLNPEAPEGDDWQRLIKLATLAIYRSTWEHSTIHGAQAGVVTNIHFGVLAPHSREEAVPYAAVQPEKLEQQLSIAHLLTDFERFYHGYLTRNPNTDINDGVISAILARKSEMNALGYDVDKILYSIHI